MNQMMDMPPKLQEALAQLHDIHQPPEPDFWPPSIEFWLLCLLLFAVIFLLWLLVHSLKGPKWYQEAKQLLQQNFKDLQTDPSQASLIALNKTLKRIALSLYGRDTVAHLHNEHWCQWLDKTGLSNHFTQGVGQCLGSKAYNPKQSFNPDSLQLLESIILQWLKSQKSKKIYQAETASDTLKKTTTFNGFRSFLTKKNPSPRGRES